MKWSDRFSRKDIERNLRLAYENSTPKKADYTQKLIDLVQEGIDDLQAVGAYAESAGLEMQLLELLKEMNK